jgi:hypothetical protein
VAILECSFLKYNLGFLGVKNCQNYSMKFGHVALHMVTVHEIRFQFIFIHLNPYFTEIIFDVKRWNIKEIKYNP